MKNNERYPNKTTTSTSPIAELETINNASDDVEADQGFWRQRKEQRGAFILLLLVIGVAVGVGVGVCVGGSNSDLDSSDFDCSDANTVGCLYIREVSLGLQSPDSFLVASCMDTNFENPTTFPFLLLGTQSAASHACLSTIPSATPGDSPMTAPILEW
jgi:hypothetical protein